MSPNEKKTVGNAEKWIVTSENPLARSVSAILNEQ